MRGNERCRDQKLMMSGPTVTRLSVNMLLTLNTLHSLYNSTTLTHHQPVRQLDWPPGTPDSILLHIFSINR